VQWAKEKAGKEAASAPLPRRVPPDMEGGTGASEFWRNGAEKW